jgi:hypothetical protein
MSNLTARSALPVHDSAAPSASIAERRLKLVGPEAAPAPAASPIWEPVGRAPGATPTTSEVLHAARAPHTLGAAREAELLAILERPLRADENHQVGNANRERELIAVIARLAPVEAHYLGRRLDAARADDRLAQGFRRLVVERRTRLRAFLASPRRQAGIPRG